MALPLLVMAVVTETVIGVKIVMMVAEIGAVMKEVAAMTAVETTAEAEMIVVMVVGREGAMEEDTTVAAEVVLIKVATTEDLAAAVGIEERLAATTSSFRKTLFSSLECPHL